MRLPREILPQVDEGTAVAELRLPAGTAIEETTRQAARIEAAAAKLGSKGVYVRVGVATDEEVLSGAEPGSAGTAVFVIPVPDGRWRRRALPMHSARRCPTSPTVRSRSTSRDSRSSVRLSVARGALVRVEVSAPKREMARGCR